MVAHPTAFGKELRYLDRINGKLPKIVLKYKMSAVKNKK
jgi:hypothetical protein